MTAEGKALKVQYQWKARVQWRGPKLDGDIASNHVHFPAKRKRDLNNQNNLSWTRSRASYGVPRQRP